MEKPVDVRVHDADLEALRSERGGQVRGHGGLADAALTGGDGDDAGQGVGAGEGDFALGASAVELFAQRLLLGLVHDAHLDGDVFDAVEGTHAFLHVVGDLGAQGASGGGEQDLDGDGGTVDRDQVGGHHVEVGNGAADLGVDDLAESSMTESSVTGMDSTLLADVPIF